MLNKISEYQVNQLLLHYEFIDKIFNTNFTKTFKRTMWYGMNEYQKPLLKSVFSNGRKWRRMMDKFLAL